MPISNYNIYFLMRIRRWSLTNEVPTCAPHQIDLKFIECWDKIFQLMRGFYWAFIDTALAIVLQAPLDSINTLWTDVGLMWTLDQHSTTSTVHVTRPGIKLQKSAELFLYFMRRFPFSLSTFMICEVIKFSVSFWPNLMSDVKLYGTNL